MANSDYWGGFIDGYAHRKLFPLYAKKKIVKELKTHIEYNKNIAEFFKSKSEDDMEVM